MASSSSKRENARGREEMAAITKDAIRFVEMAKDSDVNSKFLLDKATEAMGKVYHSLQTSTKQGKITRHQITGDYYNCFNKREKGCPAKKHVQQVSSHEYRVVYFRSHTCGGIQNHHQQQQQHSPPLDPSEHGSATVQIPNSSSSIRATSSPEPAGQNDEVDEYLHALLEQFVSSGEEIDLDSVLRRT